jgi:hypothetical protein
MWLFTTIGFFSVVADPDHPNTVTVRAHTREDLEALRRHHLPDLEISEAGEPEYRFCAWVARDEWTHAAEGLAAAIDYPSFEHAVSERQGGERAARWRALLGLQG